jgi:NAD(P)-dependent dehydrogenase (short-subunit alcohol dehydrogenase family)
VLASGTVPSATDLTQRVALVTGADRTLGCGLAAALVDAGARVAALGPCGDQRVTVVDGTLDSRAGAAEVLERAARVLEAPVDVVVHAGQAERARLTAFTDVTDADWDAVWEDTMRSTLFLFQAAFPAMRDAGYGRLVIVTPTLSMSGAPGLVPLAAAVEGQRLLAKSAARQWGEFGITVNCIAPAPELVLDGVRADSVSLAPPALGNAGDARTDIGPVVTFLVSDAGHFVTGATVCVDGGVWMSP